MNRSGFGPTADVLRDHREFGAGLSGALSTEARRQWVQEQILTISLNNILNPDVTAIGIAAVRGSGGLFAVQDFSRPVVDLSLEQQEDKVISLLKSSGLPGAIATEDARTTCKLDEPYKMPLRCT